MSTFGVSSTYVLYVQLLMHVRRLLRSWVVVRGVTAEPTKLVRLCARVGKAGFQPALG